MLHLGCSTQLAINEYKQWSWTDEITGEPAGATAETLNSVCRAWNTQPTSALGRGEEGTPRE